MFEILSQQLEKIFKRLKGKGRVTERDIDQTLRELRVVLLEADVNLKVVKSFTEMVKTRAIGQEVLESLTPAQQVIKIVKEELTKILGEEEVELRLSPTPPTTLLLIGLQGSGKTTTCAKLAHRFKAKGHSPLLVAADTKRPAAQEQLKILGSSMGIKTIFAHQDEDPKALILRIKELAIKESYEPIIVDTAGRLHIDQELMQELKIMKEAIATGEVILVLDAMTGQDAVNIAQTFNQELGFDGSILTKLDGDARGGAALSLRMVTQRPIKFVGTGEKVTDLELFYPERIASRILGMGDLLTLIERVQEKADLEEAKRAQQKLLKDEFDLEDFLKEIKRIKGMGSLDELMKMIPGIGKGLPQFETRDLSRTEAIINSMTPPERHTPRIINGSRRRRIAQGSGTSVREVNLLLAQFEEIKRLMKKMRKGRFGLMGQRFFI
ncbi:TPA: signal recognition particle protein [bacterium]|nr:signal recognition particle protein [bacterium]